MKLATFTQKPLSEVPVNLRGFWDIGGRPVYSCDNANYGACDSLGVAKLLGMQDIDDVVGSFSLVKF